MLDLLKIEWLKYKNYRTFWFLIIAFFGFLILFYGSVSLGWISIKGNGLNLIDKASTYSQIWNDLCFYASYFVIILSILMIILNTNEIQFRTNRQNIIDGWTRLEFYHLKWLIIIGISLVIAFFVLIFGFIVGLFSGVPFYSFFHDLNNILWLFLLCVNYLGFAFVLSILLKRSGLTIGILMFYSLMVEMILHALFLFKYKFPAGDFFLPLQASDELLPSNASKMIKIGLHTDNPPIWAFATVTIAWIILYYLIGRWKLMKKDW